MDKILGYLMIAIIGICIACTIIYMFNELAIKFVELIDTLPFK